MTKIAKASSQSPAVVVVVVAVVVVVVETWCPGPLEKGFPSKR